ncbi:MAG: molybdenum cofactor guanylyltransferase [Solirubrobacteraceae bacterium]
MSSPQPEPVGVVLAGGRGRRLGGDKAIAMLGGRTLAAYPLRALHAVLADVRVVAKPDTPLDGLEGMTVWREPRFPSHPLVGIVHALALAAPRAVLVCAADMPFVSAAVLARLASADARGAPAVIAARDGALEPLLGRYEQAAAELLAPGAREGHAPLRAVVASIGPRVIDLDGEEPELLFNVNTPEDLTRAEAILGRLTTERSLGARP